MPRQFSFLNKQAGKQASKEATCFPFLIFTSVRIVAFRSFVHSFLFYLFGNGQVSFFLSLTNRGKVDLSVLMSVLIKKKVTCLETAKPTPLKCYCRVMPLSGSARLAWWSLSRDSRS